MAESDQERLRAMTARAKRTRRRTPRWLWTIALTVAVVCVGALAYGWLTSDHVVATQPATPAPANRGFATGLGLGAIIGAAGAAIAIRARRLRR